MGETRQTPSRLFAAVRKVQDDQFRLGDGHERARARARLLQSVEGSLARSSRPSPVEASPNNSWRWLLGSVVAAACATAVILNLPTADQPIAQQLDTPHPLAFVLDGAEPIASDRAIVASNEPRVLDFDDNTRVELEPQGELRVSDLRSNGATIQLAQGEVELSVHHEHDTSWQVAAGPWSVHVTGTKFSVAWDPTTEHFRVAVSEGSVRVEGPEGDVAKLSAGETLVRERSDEPLASRDERVPSEPEAPVIDNVIDNVIELEPSQPQPQVKANKAEANKPEANKAEANKAEAIDWQAEASASRYAEAWAALESRKGGVLGEAERADASAMLDLADVARFTDHRADAKRVLERLRERFAGSVQAGDAAFELGRIAADAGHDDQAATWFETYLDERPQGSLVNDALVRLMNAYDSLEQIDAARSAATRYLERQPKGTHASKAQKILDR